MTEEKLQGDVLSVEDLLKIKIFEGVQAPLLEKNKGAVVRRCFQKGDVICREGDYGSTAFYLLKGHVRVFIKAPLLSVKKTTSKKDGWGSRLIRRMKSFLVKPDIGSSDYNPIIPIDASVDLSYANPVAYLKEGELFGEMTCLSRYPRSATVVAEDDCELLEMLQNILQICQRNPNFKKQLEDVYRERALASHLLSVPLFEGVDHAFLELIKSRIQLISFEAGQTIVEEGAPGDAFYIVRIGFVKVSRSFPGGSMTLNYLSKGSFFGEMSLISQQPRVATCTALDHVELVKIAAEDFRLLLSRFTDVEQKLRKIASERESANQSLLNLPRDTSLDDFLDQGLSEAQNLLVIDLKKCTRCDACVEACSGTHDGITRLIRDGLRYDDHLVATSCRQCLDPLCMVGCPVGAIRRKESLEIVIEDWCIGCSLCARNCPYGNINMHPFEVMEGDPKNPGVMKAATKKKATTCDLCMELDEPSCVYACPHDAAHRANPKDYFQRP